MDKKKKSRWQEWLVSLLITLALMGAVVGFQLWQMDNVRVLANTELLWRLNIIGDVVGGLVVLLLLHHFLKKPQDDSGK